MKAKVKSAVSFISDYEEQLCEVAKSNQCDGVICGHIHQPQIREVTNKKGSCIYLNSGDWVENLSALEYHNEEWKIFYYDDHKDSLKEDTSEEIHDIHPSDLMKLVTQFT